METTVITPDFSNTLIVASIFASLEETESTLGVAGFGESPHTFDMAKTPLEDDEDEDEDDDDLEDDDDDLEDDDLDDEDEDDDLEDDEDDDDDEDDEDDEVEDDDPKPLRVKTRA